MRGKVRLCSSRRSWAGITPAHAGKRLRGAYGGLYAGDHPRTCGEKLNLTPEQGPFLGSPPHMRGKAPPPVAAFRLSGITPAHAGKSRQVNVPGAPYRDHPRTCGEKPPVQGIHLCDLGSPPHMRGKDRFPLDTGGRHGITPAHAGKRKSKCSISKSLWDHPRTCGEKA